MRACARARRCPGATVSKWRSRCLAARLDGLSDEPRPGGPRTITDEQVDQVIVKTLEETPGQDTRWSTRRSGRASGYYAS